MEIERKYLLVHGRYEHLPPGFSEIYEHLDDLITDFQYNGIDIKQGYLDKESGNNLISDVGIILKFKPNEYRLRDKNNNKFLTIKGSGDLCREEFEVGISNAPIMCSSVDFPDPLGPIIARNSFFFILRSTPLRACVCTPST